jgi:hypothetical protein
MLFLRHPCQSRWEQSVAGIEKEGDRCCHDCDETVVLPARIAEFQAHQLAESVDPLHLHLIANDPRYAAALVAMGYDPDLVEAHRKAVLNKQ